MAKSFSPVRVLAALGLSLISTAALAQFGTIFNAPPRPPSDVPSRPPAPAPLGLPQQMPPEEMDEDAAPPPQAAPRQPPAANRQYPAGQPPGGIVRSQPLPPPPGATVAPPPQQAGVPPRGVPPGQVLQPLQPGAPAPQQPRGTPEPANVAPQPDDVVITEMPTQKIANPTAVFSGLDKITGRITTFDVALNETVQFGALQVTPRVCYTRPPTESANTDGYVDVNEVTLQGEVKPIFSGWMFAASPGLHAVEHPIYDVWLSDCKGGAPAVADVQPTPQPAQRQPAQRPPGAARPAPPGATAPRQAVQQPTLQQPNAPQPRQPMQAPAPVPPPFQTR